MIGFNSSSYAGLELLASIILVVDGQHRIKYVNPAGELALGASRKILYKCGLEDVFLNTIEMGEVIADVVANKFSNKQQEITLDRIFNHEQLHVHMIVSFMETPKNHVIIELRENMQQIRVDREERMLDQSQANKELIRNLAHEIKNPLGGIRGAAQLLEFELEDRDLKEYTQVIIKEADRLQTLVDRLLAPHRRPHLVSDVNIHEVCERVRSLILAEFPSGLVIERDYDLSLPEFRADREQLIQAVLNIAHNAAQALAEKIAEGSAKIGFVTRIARQVTFAKTRYRLALVLHVTDNGPGIPEEIKDKIFFPLVTGREGGSGLGLTLAQTFIQQHHGMIECESRPGKTDFRIMLPLL